MKKIIIIFLFILSAFDAQAQCAMCRASVASTLSEGSNLAVGLNTGIIYLASMPYLAIAIVGYLWYRNSLKNKKELQRN